MVALAHLGALVILFVVSLPPGVGIALGLAVIVSAVRALRAAAQLGPDAVVALSHSEDGGWAVRERARPDWRAVDVLGSLRHPRWVMLGFRSEAARARRLPIPWDAMSPEEFRRLRAALAAERSGAPDRR